MMIYGRAAIKQTFATNAGSLLPWLLKLWTLRYEMILDSNISCGYTPEGEVHMLGYVTKKQGRWMTRSEEPLLGT